MCSEVLAAKISKNGQITLPKAVRDRKRWTPGTILTVELTADGVLLRDAQLTNARPFPLTRPEDVFGMLKYDGPPAKIEDFDAAISREVKRRHARGEY